LILLVGATGFEPVTWSTQNSRATRLRYAPAPPASIHGSLCPSKPSAPLEMALRHRDDRPQPCARAPLRRGRDRERRGEDHSADKRDCDFSAS
jgi:hypothetical protein